MKLDFDKIGKTAALVSTLVLAALMINILILNAKTVDANGDKNMSKSVSYRTFDEGDPDLYNSISFSENESGSKKSAPKIKLLENNRPVALLKCDSTFLINQKGEIKNGSDSLYILDLPIITCNKVHIDTLNNRIVNEDVQEVLSFLRVLKKKPELFQLLSGIDTNSKGIVAYLNWGTVLPVIFGHGFWNEKIEYLDEYLHTLGSHELTLNAKYLDLRVNGRIVVKKNV